MGATTRAPVGANNDDDDDDNDDYYIRSDCLRSIIRVRSPPVAMQVETTHESSFASHY